MDEGDRTGGLVEVDTVEEATVEAEGVRWEPLAVDMGEEDTAWALVVALHGVVGHLLGSSMEVQGRAMEPILQQHLGEMEEDMVAAQVVLEVVTHGAMEEDATTEGIEEKCERTQICRELRVLLELNTCNICEL